MLLGEAGHGAGLALAGKRAASDRTPHRSGSAPYHSGRSQHWIKMKGGIFVLRPPRERPIACFLSPLFHPLLSDALSRAWNRSSACQWIVRSWPAP